MGKSKWRGIVVGLLAFTVGTSAQAAQQCNPHVAPPDHGDETICVTGAHFWNGSESDIRAIESVPVPDSFRRAFDPGRSCRNTVPHSLSRWHLAFGSERSTTAALSYLERTIRPSMTAPPEYLGQIRRAWRAAQADLRCAQTVQQPAGVNYSAQWAFMERSRPIMRLRELMGFRWEYEVLAEEYLLAAEEFGSAHLLSRAEDYLRPLVAEAQFLLPLEGVQPATGLLHFNLNTYRSDTLRLRAAVLRAQLTRSPADLRTAQDMLAAMERPLYRRIVETAFSGGDDFCDISEGWNQSEVIEAECRSDDAIQERVVGHAIAGGVLDALFRPTHAADDEAIVRLLEREQSAEGGRCCWASPRQDLIRLLLARADGVWFILPDRLRDGAARDEVEDLWRAALQDLERAERLLDPPHEPQRFERVAQRWLHLWSLANQFGEDDGRPNPAASDSHRRYATYLRRMLANIDAIATGADAGS